MSHQSRFSLSGLAGMNNGELHAIDVMAGLAGIVDVAELESALGEMVNFAETIDETDTESALGAIQTLRAGLINPLISRVTPQTQSKAFAALERQKAILNAGTKLQADDAQRPNVFIFVRFNHLAAGLKSVNNLRPSLPAQSTVATADGPLHLIQARTFLRSGSWAAAELDIKVARIPSTQLVAPEGDPAPAGLPIEYWANQSYNTGLKPARIRGLEQADSNTIIGLDSTAVEPVNYGVVLEMVMESFMSGPCGIIRPTLLRGPMNITATSAARGFRAMKR